jgi:mono/diheme cytochrome c family protein
MSLNDDTGVHGETQPAMRSRQHLSSYRWRIAGVLCLFGFALALVIDALNTCDEDDVESQLAETVADAEQIQRGAYLARAGNCQSCHTQAGAAPYAGGEGIQTPFGVVYAGNLTPDKKTGLGSWNASYFWRAMHNGRSKDGRWLYPAFPYAQYSRLTRADTDDIFAYLRSLPPVEQRNRDHALRFPYNTQMALALWRALYFKPQHHQVASEQSARWNRGLYLVEGLGHCAACHSPRNALGAAADKDRHLGGSMMPSEYWYAPSLLSMSEAGVMDWPATDVMQLLQSGRIGQAYVTGPMASVVFGSTQYLTDDDLAAMTVYLKNLPKKETVIAPVEAADAMELRRGARLYDKHCAECHGDQGEGKAGMYPALRGNRTVTMHNTANLISVIRQGGFGPATEKNPRPYGMPPFGHVLSHREMADIITFLRQSWGNQASSVTELDVLRGR